MGIINAMQKSFVSWFDKNNNANFLFATAAIGWILASAAQTVGIAKSKELSKEDKKFLIPQEIADGTVNIAMYAAVTTNLMKMAEKSCKPGQNGKAPFISLKDAAGNILDYASHGAEYAKMGRNLKTGAAILGGIISTCILTPIARNAFAAYVKKKTDGKNNKDTIPVNMQSTRTQPFFTKTYNTPEPPSANKFTPLSTYPSFGISKTYQNTTGLKI